jgi:hypothetical protein
MGLVGVRLGFHLLADDLIQVPGGCDAEEAAHDVDGEVEDEEDGQRPTSAKAEPSEEDGVGGAGREWSGGGVGIHWVGLGKDTGWGRDRRGVVYA